MNVDDESDVMPPPPKRIAIMTGYTALTDCQPSERKKYNVWAVITKVTRQPSSTKGVWLMAQVYIQDPEYQGSYGFPDFQFSLLGRDYDDFPPLAKGAVIRIHHMKVETYNGAATGRVFDPRGVVLIRGNPGDPIEPETRHPNLKFTQEDRQMVVDLRAWWALEVRRRHIQASNGLSQTMTRKMQDITEETVFDLYCKVLGLVDGKAILVTDGTACKLPLLSSSRRLNYEANRKEIVVFVSYGIMAVVKSDNYVILKETKCVKTDLGYKIVNESRGPAGYHVLPPRHAAIKEIQRTMDPTTTGENDPYAITDHTIEALMANTESMDISLNPSLLHPANPVPVATSTQKTNMEEDSSSAPMVAIYPANADALIMESVESMEEEESPSMTTPAPAPAASTPPSSTQTVTSSLMLNEENEETQVYYTCQTQPQTPMDERCSPSPERESPPMIVTTSNFTWTSICELNDQDYNSAGNNVDRFRLNAYVKEIEPKLTLADLNNSDAWTKCLCRLCKNCCIPSPFEPDDDDGSKKCQDCNMDLDTVYHFVITVVESRPGLIAHRTASEKLYLTGVHAQKLIGVHPDTLKADPGLRLATLSKLYRCVGKPVSLSVIAMATGAKRIYQIVNSNYA